MGIKNIFKKSSSDQTNRDSFYIVLFICLCIVAVTAVYVTRHNANIAQRTAQNSKKIQEQQVQQGNLQSVTTKDTNISTAIQQQNKNEKPEIQSRKTSKRVSRRSSHAINTLKLAMPVKGDIVKKYDKENLQESKTMQQWETHEGIDIACDIGTEVKAALEGKVVDVFNDDTVLKEVKTGFGVTVVIEHENGVRTVYSNLSEEVKVKKGDTVKSGQVIGVVGDTAVRESVSIEGSHLHFAVLKKSGKDYSTVNPQDYIK